MIKCKNSIYSIVFFGIVLLFSVVACKDECDPELNDEVGKEFFTVEYRSKSGQNYIEDVYNRSRVFAYLDKSGGTNPNAKLELLDSAVNEGKFGPFKFTRDFIDPVTGKVNGPKFLGISHVYDYYLVKDLFGTDTLRVRFYMGVDECNQRWRQIRYYLNGDTLDTFEDQQQAEIVIVE